MTDDTLKYAGFLQPYQHRHPLQPSRNAFNPADRKGGILGYIEMDDHEKTLKLKSPNHYEVKVAQRITLNSQSAEFKSKQGSIHFAATDGILQIHGNTFLCNTNGGNIKITGSEIILSGESIQIETTSATQPTNIACLGDKHLCPQLDPNGTPHLGGTISSGSQTVLLNNKPIARQHDSAPCGEHPNHIQMGIAGLQIENQSVSGIGCVTAHAGAISSGNPKVEICPTIFGQATNSQKMPYQKTQAAFLSIQNQTVNAKTLQATLHLGAKRRFSTLHNGSGYFEELPNNISTSLLTLEIEGF